MLTEEEEECIVNWLKQQLKEGYSCTISLLCLAAQSILNSRNAVTKFKDNLPGRKWCRLFANRHPDIFVSKKKAGYPDFIPLNVPTTSKEFPQGNKDCIMDQSQPLDIVKDSTDQNAAGVRVVPLPKPISSSKVLPNLPLPYLKTSSITTSLSSGMSISSSRPISSAVPTPSSSSQSHNDTMPAIGSSSLHLASVSSIITVSTQVTLDRLLDLAAKAGLDQLVYYNTLHCLGLEMNNHNDLDGQLFMILFSTLIKFCQDIDNDSSKNENKDLKFLPPVYTMSNEDALRNLLKLVAKAGLVKLAHYRTLGWLKIEREDSEDLEERLFNLLYTRVVKLCQDYDNDNSKPDCKMVEQVPLSTQESSEVQSSTTDNEVLNQYRVTVTNMVTSTPSTVKRAASPVKGKAVKKQRVVRNKKKTLKVIEAEAE